MGTMRFSGIDLCVVCVEDPTSALERRGVHWEVVSEWDRRAAGRHDQGVTSHCHLRVRFDESLGIRAAFSHEGIMQRVSKVFTGELQTGDALFDAAVFIRTDTPGTTAELLESEEARSAIMAIAAHHSTANLDDVELEVEGTHKGLSRADLKGEALAFVSCLLDYTP